MFHSKQKKNLHVNNYIWLDHDFFFLTILIFGFAEEADTEIQPEIQTRSMETKS